MTREIKFRGKHRENGEWLIGDLVQDHFGDGSINTCHIYPKDAWNGPDCYEVDPDTVGQYTELKDKNENEVFEGDIMDVDGELEGIYWDEEYLQYFAMNQYGSSEPLHVGFHTFKVIGNIHDNPELMKGGGDE